MGAKSNNKLLDHIDEVLREARDPATCAVFQFLAYRYLEKADPLAASLNLPVDRVQKIADYLKEQNLFQPSSMPPESMHSILDAQKYFQSERPYGPLSFKVGTCSDADLVRVIHELNGLLTFRYTRPKLVSEEQYNQFMVLADDSIRALHEAMDAACSQGVSPHWKNHFDPPILEKTRKPREGYFAQQTASFDTPEEALDEGFSNAYGTLRLPDEIVVHLEKHKQLQYVEPNVHIERVAENFDVNYQTARNVAGMIGMSFAYQQLLAEMEPEIKTRLGKLFP